MIYIRSNDRIEPTELTLNDILSVQDACEKLHLQKENIRSLAYMGVIVGAYIDVESSERTPCVLRSDVEAIQAMRSTKIPLQPILDQRGNKLPYDLTLIAKTSLLRACYDGGDLLGLIDEINKLDWFTDDQGHIFIQASLLSEPAHIEKCQVPPFVMPRHLRHIPAADHRHTIDGDWGFRERVAEAGAA
jgi:hypothetical protein